MTVAGIFQLYFQNTTGTTVSVSSQPLEGTEPSPAAFLFVLLFAMLIDRSFYNPPPSHIAAVICRAASLFLSFWFLFLFCSASITVFVSLCRLWADIILWKGNDPTVLRLCMCAAHCNGLAFYCLPHTNPTTEGMRWHLQGAVCELQPHMKEWPLKMIKEITILGCTTLISCLARCTSLCPGMHAHRHARTYTSTHSYMNLH